ncbi:hypothetical protein ACMYUJ_17205 [Stutzerimonas zhaodongensis]|uniref:hypothetical protein n=1 Tax=Stutzerimonas zhaodongensis TaxID=1176257 RepID=UPI0039EE9406
MKNTTVAELNTSDSLSHTEQLLLTLFRRMSDEDKAHKLRLASAFGAPAECEIQ